MVEATSLSPGYTEYEVTEVTTHIARAEPPMDGRVIEIIKVGGLGKTATNQ